MISSVLKQRDLDCFFKRSKQLTILEYYEGGLTPTHPVCALCSLGIIIVVFDFCF